MYKRFLSRTLVIRLSGERKGTMTALITSISAQRSSELRKYAAERRRAQRAQHGRPGRIAAQDVSARVSIRPLDPSGADHAELARLAGRDSGAAPNGASLGAELDGHLVAAVAIDGTTSIADPFAPTADVRALLELRASQLRAA
jgi:hypothetical protein